MKNLLKRIFTSKKQIMPLFLIISLIVTGLFLNYSSNANAFSYNSNELDLTNNKAGEETLTETNDEDALKNLIYEFYAFVQNTAEPSREDKAVIKKYYQDLLKSKGDDKEKIHIELKQYISKAREIKTQSNQKQLINLCTEDMIKRYGDIFDLSKNYIALNDVGGSGIIDLKIKERKINENSAIVLANIVFNRAEQLTTIKGEKFNHYIEATNDVEFRFVKVNDRWLVDYRDIINPHFDLVITKDVAVNILTDDIVEEVIIDSTSGYESNEEYDSSEVDKDVINYGQQE